MRLALEQLGSGPNVVVLPGGPGFACDYLKVGLQPLEKFVTLNFLDYPGCGRSRASQRPVTYDETIASVVDSLLEYFNGDPFHVLCHSFGALILGGLLRSQTALNIDRCALLSPSPHSLGKCVEAQQRLMLRMGASELAEVQAVLSGAILAPVDLMTRLLPYYCGRAQGLPSLPLALESQTCADVMASLRPFDDGAAFRARGDLLYIFGNADFIGLDLFSDDPNIVDRSVVLQGGHFIFADAAVGFTEAIRAHFLVGKP